MERRKNRKSRKGLKKKKKKKKVITEMKMEMELSEPYRRKWRRDRRKRMVFGETKVREQMRKKESGWLAG